MSGGSAVLEGGAAEFTEVLEAPARPAAPPVRHEVAPPAPPELVLPQKKSINKWAIALSVSLGALLEVIDTSIVNVALTDMQSALGATLSETGWVVTAYAIANVIILPLAAWLGDRFGKKRYFVFSLVAFTASSVLCGLSTSLPMLIGARVLQGLFGGGLLAKAQSILYETFPKEEQGSAQALFGAVVIAGPAIGPTLGGYIVTSLDWRWIFFINIPVGIAAVMMCMTFLENDPPFAQAAKTKVDWTGIALLTLGLGALQTVLEEGQTEDWFHSNFILAFSALALIGVVFFIYQELTTEHPVVDLRVLRYRSMWSGSLLGAVVGFGLYGAMFSVPIFVQSILGFTAQQTGFLLLPGALMTAVGMMIARPLASRFDPKVVMLVGFGMLIYAVFQLQGLAPQTSASDLFWPLIIRSIGTSFIFLPLNLAALGPIPKKDIAAATGFFSLARQLGGSFGIAFLTTFLARREVFHYNILSQKLAETSADAQSRLALMTSIFTSRGVDSNTAHAGGMAMLSGAVRLQAAVMSFGDTFFATALVLMVTLPLLFLLGKPPKGVTVDAGH